MKERPILFSTPMVQAILDGRKTMTRRVVKPQPLNGSDPNKLWHVTVPCPYGRVGDVLWVRETFGKGKASGKTYYKADNGDFHMLVEKWRPSIFMPKEACRIKLRITNVRVERLQEITEEDAICEGVKWRFADDHDCYDPLKGTVLYKNYMNDGMMQINPEESFATLWHSINGEDNWKANPWVWVVEFEKIKS